MPSTLFYTIIVGLCANVAWAIGGQQPQAAADLRAMDEDRPHLEGPQDSGIQMNFGPFVGAGTTSSQGRVRSANGYELALSRQWRAAWGIDVGPRLVLINSFVNARAKEPGMTAVASYDIRMLGAGLGLSRALDSSIPALAPKLLFANFEGGRAYAKLTVDQSRDDSFRQNQLTGIDGDWLAVELGTFVPLRSGFGVNFSGIATRQELDQSRAAGTYEGEQQNSDGALALTSGTTSAEGSALAAEARLDIIALKIGLHLKF